MSLRSAANLSFHQFETSTAFTLLKPHSPPRVMLSIARQEIDLGQSDPMDYSLQTLQNGAIGRRPNGSLAKPCKPSPGQEKRLGRAVTTFA